MTFEEIQLIQNEIAIGFAGEEGQGERVFGASFYGELQGLLKRPKTKRLSFGYSVSETGFRPEIRLYSSGGRAKSIATEIKAKYPETRILRVSSFYGANPLGKNLNSHPKLSQLGRPLTIGMCISHVEGLSGTLGGFVQREHSGKTAILSCDHILSNFAQGRCGDKIHQPSTNGGGARSREEIATFSEGIHPTRTGINTVDAAIADLIESVEYIGNVIPSGHSFPNEGQSIHFRADAAQPVAGTILEKIGKQSGHTQGRLLGLSMGSVIIGKEGEGDDYAFNDVAEVEWINGTAFAQPGDSGSLVYYQDCSSTSDASPKINALGLIFGGATLVDENNTETHVTYVCSLKQTLCELNCKWLS